MINSLVFCKGSTVFLWGLFNKYAFGTFLFGICPNQLLADELFDQFRPSKDIILKAKMLQSIKLLCGSIWTRLRPFGLQALDHATYDFRQNGIFFTVCLIGCLLLFKHAMHLVFKFQIILIVFSLSSFLTKSQIIIDFCTKAQIEGFFMANSIGNLK
jgi:hypothetical protein